MNASKNAFDLIAKYEGFRAKPYKCPAGVPTIGYGSTFYRDGSRVKISDPEISEKEAYKLMMLTANRFATRLSSFIRVPVTQNQFDAILSLVYNAGAIIYKSTLIRKLNSGNYAGAANEFSKWTHVNGKVDPGLVSRRARERALFMTE